MMFIKKDWMFKLCEEADEGAAGGGADTTSVQTDTGNETVLTSSEDESQPDAVDSTDESGEGNKAETDETGEGSSQTPDTYADFTMPEGIKVDDALLAEATPLFKELGLNQEQAQKLVDLQTKQIQASSQSQVDAFNQLMNDWQDKSKNDKEFGGDKFEENVKVARSAVERFGTPELKQLLEEHGVGNHPEVIRFMVKVGKMTAEDVPGGTTTPPSKAQDRVSRLYPNDKNA